jgi:hypothetical protein
MHRIQPLDTSHYIAMVSNTRVIGRSLKKPLFNDTNALDYHFVRSIQFAFS